MARKLTIKDGEILIKIIEKKWDDITPEIIDKFRPYVHIMEDLKNAIDLYDREHT